MRKSKEETAQTRQRIVEAAAVEFRRTGISGTAVSDLMGAAGLTHGGFYRHFESKDALVKESFAIAIDSLAASMQRSLEGRPGIAGIVAVMEDYLSTCHRDSKDCCPFVSLSSELARENKGVRDAATHGFLKVAEIIAPHLPGRPAAAAKKEATVILSTMIGAMSIARLVSDKEVSSSILNETKKSLLQQLKAKRS
jgi:TetR/AcrR family transcriptional repressor of nem operon